jgi:hypothetical protein
MGGRGSPYPAECQAGGFGRPFHFGHTPTKERFVARIIMALVGRGCSAPVQAGKCKKPREEKGRENARIWLACCPAGRARDTIRRRSFSVRSFVVSRFARLSAAGSAGGAGHEARPAILPRTCRHSDRASGHDDRQATLRRGVACLQDRRCDRSVILREWRR